MFSNELKSTYQKTLSCWDIMWELSSDLNRNKEGVTEPSYTKKVNFFARSFDLLNFVFSNYVLLLLLIVYYLTGINHVSSCKYELGLSMGKND